MAPNLPPALATADRVTDALINENRFPMYSRRSVESLMRGESWWRQTWLKRHRWKWKVMALTRLYELSQQHLHDWHLTALLLFNGSRPHEKINASSPDCVYFQCCSVFVLDPKNGGDRPKTNTIPLCWPEAGSSQFQGNQISAWVKKSISLIFITVTKLIHRNMVQGQQCVVIVDLFSS